MKLREDSLNKVGKQKKITMLFRLQKVFTSGNSCWKAQNARPSTEELDVARHAHVD